MRLPVAVLLIALTVQAASAANFEKADGYRGIWYFNQPTNDEYVYKYSGGLGTYCANHIPMAVYAPKVNKTFFVYGGTTPGNDTLLEMAGYYDHATGKVPRPTILMDKKTTDAHDNPVIALDDAGHVWVFASSHGTSRPSYIFKSKKPYDIDDFDMVFKTNFSYPQPWHIPGRGFLFMHTRYSPGRACYWMTSPDGITWSDGHCLAYIAQGHYQNTWPCGSRVGSTFNYHPEKLGLNYRTNLYYVQTDDMGATWKNVAGETIQTPLKDIQNPALVHDYEAEGLKIYINDLNYDGAGNPVIFYVTTKGWNPGPENGPREWRVAHWTGAEWQFHKITDCDNNYDMGSIYIEPDGLWRVIGPAIPGPQPYNPGGEIGVWISKDEGATWEMTKQLTHGSEFNHTYVRRPLNANPGFYAYWADGHGRKPSPSRLYFADKDGNVNRLPYNMPEDFANPEPVP